MNATKDRREVKKTKRGRDSTIIWDVFSPPFSPFVLVWKYWSPSIFLFVFRVRELEKECNLSHSNQRTPFSLSHGKGIQFLSWVDKSTVCREKKRGWERNDTGNYYYLLLFQNTTRHLIRYTKIDEEVGRDASNSRLNSRSILSFIVEMGENSRYSEPLLCRFSTRNEEGKEGSEDSRLCTYSPVLFRFPLSESRTTLEVVVKDGYYAAYW